MKIDVGRRSIDPIRDSLKREAHFRRQITRELAIWPLHTWEGEKSGGIVRAWIQLALSIMAIIRKDREGKRGAVCVRVQ